LRWANVRDLARCEIIHREERAPRTGGFSRPEVRTTSDPHRLFDFLARLAPDFLVGIFSRPGQFRASYDRAAVAQLVEYQLHVGSKTGAGKVAELGALAVT